MQEGGEGICDGDVRRARALRVLSVQVKQLPLPIAAASCMVLSATDDAQVIASGVHGQAWQVVAYKTFGAPYPAMVPLGLRAAQRRLLFTDLRESSAERACVPPNCSVSTERAAVRRERPVAGLAQTAEDVAFAQLV